MTEEQIAPVPSGTFVTVDLHILGSDYELYRTLHLIGALGEEPRLDTVSIEVVDDDGGRFRVHFDDDAAVARFALRLLAQVKPYIEGS